MKVFSVNLAQRTASKINFFFMTGAFVLYLLACISTPVTKGKSLTFLQYTFPAEGSIPATELQIGLWGSCRQPIGGVQVCTKPMSPFLVELSGLGGRKNAGNPFVVGKLVIPVAVLLPIATGAAFGAMLLAFSQSHFSLLLTQVAAVLGQAAMIIMFVLFQRTDSQIRAAYPNFLPGQGGLGTMNWVVLSGALSASVALLFSIMGTAGTERRNGSLIKKVVYV